MIGESAAHLRDGQPDPVCRDDAQENNDTADAAVPLLPGDFDGMVACPEDEDWFLVRLEAGSTARVDVELGFSHADSDLDLHLVDSDGAPSNARPGCIWSSTTPAS